MTITKEAWEILKGKYPSRFVMHSPSARPLTHNVQLVCEDGLGRLRNKGINAWIDNKTGTYKKTNCRQFFVEFLHETLAIAATYPDIEIFVLSLDPVGNPRPEKGGTHKKREAARTSKEDTPTTLHIPIGQQRYFEDDCPMPGTMNLIMGTSAARSELYTYLTHLISSDSFRKMLPEGLTFIFSGARHENTNLPPLQITKEEGVRVMVEEFFPTLSEGDLDVVRFAHIYHDKNAHILSLDGDILLIMLLHTRFALTRCEERQLTMVTKRSDGSEEASEQKQIAKEVRATIYSSVLEETGSNEMAFSASAGTTPAAVEAAKKRAPRREPKWMLNYVDVTGLFFDIVEESLQIVREARLRFNDTSFTMHNPIESYVVALCLSSSSHDYIQTGRISRQVNSSIVWEAYRTNLIFIGDLVQVYHRKGGADQPFRYFAINVPALKRLVQKLYETKIYSALKPTKALNTEAKLEAEGRRRLKDIMEKHAPSDSDLCVVASQCAWTLQYWGNGVFKDLEICDGLQIDEESGLPIYGYRKGDWADDVTKSEMKIAPLPPK